MLLHLKLVIFEALGPEVVESGSAELTISAIQPLAYSEPLPGVPERQLKAPPDGAR